MRRSSVTIIRSYELGKLINRLYYLTHLRIVDPVSKVTCTATLYSYHNIGHCGTVNTELKLWTHYLKLSRRSELRFQSLTLDTVCITGKRGNGSLTSTIPWNPSALNQVLWTLTWVLYILSWFKLSVGQPSKADSLLWKLFSSILLNTRACLFWASNSHIPSRPHTRWPLLRNGIYLTSRQRCV